MTRFTIRCRTPALSTAAGTGTGTGTTGIGAGSVLFGASVFRGSGAVSIFGGSGAVFATALGAWISPDNLNRALKNILEWSDSKHLLEQYEPDGEPPRTAKKGESLTNLERRIRAVPVPHRARLEAIVRAGVALPEITPHDLRHTYATLALRSKVPVAVVSKTLGHARISITMDIYRHVLPSEMKENVFDLFAVPLPVRDVPVIAVN